MRSLKLLPLVLLAVGSLTVPTGQSSAADLGSSTVVTPWNPAVRVTTSTVVVNFEVAPGCSLHALGLFTGRDIEVWGALEANINAPGGGIYEVPTSVSRTDHGTAVIQMKFDSRVVDREIRQRILQWTLTINQPADRTDDWWMLQWGTYLGGSAPCAFTNHGFHLPFHLVPGK